MRDVRPGLPALAAMSPDVCNAHLQGGPYDGQITYIPDDVTTYAIRGIATYQRTEDHAGGRRIYRAAESRAP